jgi:hypothetical protein
MAQPSNTKPPKVRDEFLRGQGKNKMRLENLANAMPSPPFSRVTNTSVALSVLSPLSACVFERGELCFFYAFFVYYVFFVALAVKRQSY